MTGQALKKPQKSAAAEVPGGSESGERAGRGRRSAPLLEKAKSAGNVREWLGFGAVVAILTITVCFSRYTKAGISEGLRLSAEVLIPTLFPTMVWAQLLRLPPSGERGGRHVWLPVVAVGWLCGLPMGAKLTAENVRAGRVSARQGERALAAVQVCGPAFVLFGVGAGCRGSVAEGAVLWLVTLLSTLLARIPAGGVARGAASRERTDEAGGANGSGERRTPDLSLPAAVSRAVVNMAEVCGSVCLFCALSALPRALLSPKAGAVCAALLEVTGGVSALAQAWGTHTRAGFALTASALAWGGCSVALQTALLAREGKMRMGPYLRQKAMAGGIAWVLGSLAWGFFGF